MLNGNENNKLQPQNYMVAYQEENYELRKDRKKRTHSVYVSIKHSQTNNIIFRDTNTYNKTI